MNFQVLEIYCRRLINAEKRLQEEEKRRESIDKGE